MNIDYEVDVAVVGGGACGYVAALMAASDPNLTVALFEKDSRTLSNADISSGTLAAGGTRWQDAAGIEDSPDKHARDILKKSGSAADVEVVRALCEAAPKYVAWLADELGVPIILHERSRRVGHATPRLHADAQRLGGAVLMTALRAALDSRGNAHLIDKTPGVGLLHDGDRVEGVKVLENGSERTVLAERAVVLACDGFGANQSLVARHIPEIVGAPYIGVEGNTGDAFAWAADLGAAFDHMGSYQGHGFVVVDHQTRLEPSIVLEGGIIVDGHGRRFVAEDMGYSELVPHLRSHQSGVTVEIWDQAIMERLPPSELMRDSEKAGAYGRFETLTELAARYDLPSSVLSRSVDLYNQEVRMGRDSFGRVHFGGPLRPPFFAARITAGLAHTQGGVRVDINGGVRREDGSLVPRLYAGGGTAAGISGDGAQGYLSGNGLLAAFGMGYRIGRLLSGAPMD